MNVDEIKKFLANEWENILTVVIVFLGLLSIFAFLGINFNPVKNKTVEKVVVVESFNANANANGNGSYSLSDSFCTQFSAVPDDLEKKCNTLTKDNCKSTKCCIWLNNDNNEKCVAGDKYGPTYQRGTNVSP